MTIWKDFMETLTGLKSLLVGLKITGHEFAKHQVTVHYPRNVVDNITTFRGHIELVGKPKEQATPKCISCMMCVSVCPSGCISLKKHPKPKPPAEAEAKGGKDAETVIKPKEKATAKVKPIKTPKEFKLDYNMCSLCGLCVQNCPVSALRYSTDVYIASASSDDFRYDLMARLKDQAATAAAKADAQPSSGGGE